MGRLHVDAAAAHAASTLTSSVRGVTLVSSFSTMCAAQVVPALAACMSTWLLHLPRRRRFPLCEDSALVFILSTMYGRASVGHLLVCMQRLLADSNVLIARTHPALVSTQFKQYVMRSRQLLSLELRRLRR